MKVKTGLFISIIPMTTLECFWCDIEKNNINYNKNISYCKMVIITKYIKRGLVIFSAVVVVPMNIKVILNMLKLYIALVNIG